MLPGNVNVAMYVSGYVHKMPFLALYLRRTFVLNIYLDAMFGREPSLYLSGQIVSRHNVIDNIFGQIILKSHARASSANISRIMIGCLNHSYGMKSRVTCPPI